MARVNIEQCWWTDPRREKLATLLGSLLLADAVAIRAWKVAQEFWGQSRGLIPGHVFETLESHDKLLAANLAEERKDGIYIRGSSQYLEWIFDRREAAKTGGKASAKRPRGENGRFQPKVSAEESKQTPSNDQAKTNQNQASDSGSGSISGSNSNSNTLSAVDKSTRRKQKLFQPEDTNALLMGFEPETLETWVQLYPDAEFRRREAIRAFEYYRDAGRKRPNTIGGWKRALSSWLERSWPRHVRTLSPTKEIKQFTVPD